MDIIFKLPVILAKNVLILIVQFVFLKHNAKFVMPSSLLLLMKVELLADHVDHIAQLAMLLIVLVVFHTRTISLINLCVNVILMLILFLV